MKTINRQFGFTLVETLMYMSIAALLLIIIATSIINIMNGNKRLKSVSMVQQNAHFISNYLQSEIHNVDLIEDVSPDPEHYLFYDLPDKRFSLTIEDDDLVYRSAEDSGSGFPDLSTVDPVVLNTNNIRVSNLDMTAVKDSQDNDNRGIIIDFSLTTGVVGDLYGYYSESFNFFFTIR